MEGYNKLTHSLLPVPCMPQERGLGAKEQGGGRAQGNPGEGRGGEGPPHPLGLRTQGPQEELIIKWVAALLLLDNGWRGKHRGNG